jgi:putative ABC transport system ATP-binding protein
MNGAEVCFSSVSKTYRTGAGLPVQALDQLTLDIPGGQAVAVTGRSGSGKSTLLHLAGAMDDRDSGTITVDGRDLGTMNEKQRTLYRRGVGFVFQRFHLLPTLTACDNVAAPVLPFRTGYDKRGKARDLLTAVGLAGREHDLPAKLSGGQQQRIAIARALIGDPRLLLADEPTGSLDTQRGREVLELLTELCREHQVAIVLVSHDPQAAAYADRVYALRDGKLGEYEPDQWAARVSAQ